MTIPVTASEGAFTPACLEDIEGAPSFVFRDATRLDKLDTVTNLAAERIMRHSKESIREVTLSEMKRLFQSENMAANVTALTAYWQAIDEHDLAVTQWTTQVAEIWQETPEGETPKLPPEPKFDFDEDRAAELDALIDEVRRHSDRLAAMNADNMRFNIHWPRMLLRMLLKSTTLDVDLTRRAGLMTAESAEMVLDRLEKVAEKHGAERGLATQQLLTKATLSMQITEDEEKNSSSPRSGSTPPKASAKTPSSSTSGTEASSSPSPADAAPDPGSKSSD